MATGHGLVERVHVPLQFVTTVAMLVAAVTLAWWGYQDRRTPPPPSPTSIAVPDHLVPLRGATIIGSSSAPVVLAAFTDYECPFCARWESIVFPEIEANYINQGLVSVAYWNLPLAIHPNAEIAARSAECASLDARFRPMHTWLFANLKKLDRPSIEEEAGALGLNQAAFVACVEGEASKAAVELDLALAKSLGVQATPGFLIGRRQADGVKVESTISGGRPFAEFKAALDRLLGT